MNALCEYLRDSWGELGLEPAAPPARLSCLVRTPRFRASSHVLLFVFANRGPEPILIAKVPRLPGDHGALDREAGNLAALSCFHPEKIEGVPRLVAYRDWHDTKLLLQSVVPGDPMSPARVRERPAESLHAVMRWVTQLHVATRGFQTGSSGTIRRCIDRTLEELGAVLPAAAPKGPMLERARVLTEPLGRHVLPRVFEHGDLSSPNILVDGEGRVGVVDWELGDPVGLPGADVFFLLTYIAFARADANRTGRYVEAFANAFFGPGSWARPVVAEYAAAIGLPERILRPLFLLSWARYLAGMTTRMHEPDPAAPAPDWVEWFASNRYFALWRYTLEHWEDLDL
jgi:aminoglycoside phosphotransferase